MTRRFILRQLRAEGINLPTDAVDAIFREFHGVTDRTFKNSALMQNMWRLGIESKIALEKIIMATDSSSSFSLREDD